MTFEPTVANCDEYLGERTGRYEWRAVRYRAAAEAMIANGLDDTHTVVDMGAGWTEFAYCLHAEYGWRGRYIPIDGGIDGTDLATWTPKRSVEWYVALEILEHLEDPERLISQMQLSTTMGIIVSTPNPRTTDVLGMDATHLCEVDPNLLLSWDFAVCERMFYGGKWSEGQSDSLFGVYLANPTRTVADHERLALASIQGVPA